MWSSYVLVPKWSINDEILKQKFCNSRFPDHIQPTLTRHFQFKVQNYGIAYQRTLETAHLSTDLKASWSVICSTITKTRKKYAVYVTAPLQLSDAGAGVVFGCKQDRHWLSPSGTAEFTYSCRLLQWSGGTGLSSRNSQICPTRFRISELGNQVQIFDTFDRGFSTADKLFALEQILIDFPGTGDNRGLFPISMVHRSEGSLKSELLSLVRTSKYVTNTNIKHQLRGGQLGLTKLCSYCSDKLIYMLSCKIVVSNKNIYGIWKLN